MVKAKFTDSVEENLENESTLIQEDSDDIISIKQEDKNIVLNKSSQD